MTENRISLERIAEVDAKYRPPEKRAEDIFAVFQLAAQELDLDWSLYDLVCFAAQFLGTASLTWAQDDEELREIAIRANRWLMNRHYLLAERMFGGGEDANKTKSNDEGQDGSDSH